MLLPVKPLPLLPLAYVSTLLLLPPPLQVESMKKAA